MSTTAIEIPYPAVFRDWQFRECRVATSVGAAGTFVEIFQPENGVWRRVELTEQDACLLAAALLRNAGQDKLSRRVLQRLGRT